MEVDDEEDEDLRLGSLLLLRWCFDADVDDEVRLELECTLVGVPVPPVLLLPPLLDGRWWPRSLELLCLPDECSEWCFFDGSLDVDVELLDFFADEDELLWWLFFCGVRVVDSEPADEDDVFVLGLGVSVIGAPAAASVGVAEWSLGGTTRG